jgi:phosphoribosylformylglycinamidine (FGAM) synthase-like enzyme
MGSTIQHEATLEEANKLGLKAEEFEMIKKILGRTPNFTETSILGVMWSEHCSYKNVIKWLKALPTNQDENAGIVDLGDGIGCVLNIGSHNNQSDAAPRINRFPFSMEVQTIAQMNSLRFGNIEKKETKKSLKKVTKGISDAANKSGTHTIEGNVFFDDSYNYKPILNTFSVGIVDTNKAKTATSGTRNTLYTFDFCSEKVIKDISAKFDIKAEEISIVTDTKNIRYFNGKELIADLPIDSLIKDGEALVNEKEIEAPAYFQEFKKFDINDVAAPEDLKEVASFLLKHPNITSKRWVNSQFNAMKRTATNSGKAPKDAGIVQIKSANRALAVTIGGNSRYVNANPEIGTSIAIAEAARNIVCAGGIPNAIATSLNFGNPNNAETLWQYTGATKGISAACLKFNTSVRSGDVSFYNQTVVEGKKAPNFPTPTIGMIGIVEDKTKTMSFDFKHKGDLIFIIGEAVECIASSEYLYSYHGVKASPAPYFNMDKEFEMQEVVKTIIQKDLVNAAHDCSSGGIFITLSEMAMPNELGFDIVTDAEIREDAFLFGEAAGRVLVGVNKDSEDAFIEFMMSTGVNFTLLGHVTQGKMVIDDDHFGFIQEAKRIYDTALEKLIEG